MDANQSPGRKRTRSETDDSLDHNSGNLPFHWPGPNRKKDLDNVSNRLLPTTNLINVLAVDVLEIIMMLFLGITLQKRITSFSDHTGNLEIFRELASES